MLDSEQPYGLLHVDVLISPFVNKKVYHLVKFRAYDNKVYFPENSCKHDCNWLAHGILNCH